MVKFVWVVGVQHSKFLKQILHTLRHVIMSLPLSPHSTKNIKTAREWCRVFSTPKRFLVRARGPAKQLINFFVERPVGVVHMLG